MEETRCLLLLPTPENLLESEIPHTAFDVGWGISMKTRPKENNLRADMDPSPRPKAGDSGFQIKAGC
jgi:hypothetical protein